MKLATFSLACLALLGLECALLRPFHLSIARVDVHVAFIVFLALRAQTLEGAFGSAAAGYFVDVLSGQPSYLYVFIGVLTYLLARLISPFVDVRSAKGFAPLVAGVDLLHSLAAWGLVSLSSPPGVVRDAMLSGTLPTALLSGIAALAAWPLLRAIENLYKKPESGLIF